MNKIITTNPIGGTINASRPEVSNIQAPAELRELQGWLIWRLEPDASNPNGKPLKVPYYADGGKRHGKQGGIDDRRRMTTFAVARDAAARLGFTGVGLALMPEFGITALDFDNCVDAQGKLPPEIEQIASQTYAEYSPSGMGVRAFVRGFYGNRKSPTAGNDYGFETFTSNGFVTFTGNAMPYTDILGLEDTVADLDTLVAPLCAARFSATQQRSADPDDFMAGHEPILNLTVERMQELLAALDPNMGREDWIRVGMALHHECDGGDTGLELWDDWSSEGYTYPSTEGLRVQWESFERRKGSGQANITMATVLKMVKDQTHTATPTAATAIGVSEEKRQITPTPYHWRDPVTIPPRPWLFGRWLLKGTVACIVAPGGIGKSTFTGAMAISFATGKNLLGKEVWGGPKKVWSWNLEDDLDELSRVLQATCRHYSITPEDIGDRLFVDSGMEGATLCTATEGRQEAFINDRVFDEIAEEVRRRGIEVLIVDPFVSSHAVDENSNSKIDKIAKAWGRLAKAAGCVVVLVHHTSKAGSFEVSANSARGASALISAARSVLTLNRMKIDEAQKYGITDERRRRHFAVIDDKHNRAPAETDAWFQLVSVELENGDSVAVCTPWALPVLDLKPDDKDIIALQDIIDEGSYRDHFRATDWVGNAIAEVLKLDVNDSGHRARIKATQKLLKAEKYLIVNYKKDKKGKEIPYIGCAKRPDINEG